MKHVEMMHWLVRVAFIPNNPMLMLPPTRDLAQRGYFRVECVDRFETTQGEVEAEYLPTM